MLLDNLRKGAGRLFGMILMGLLVGVIVNSQRTWERPKPLQRKRSLTEVIG